MSIATRAVKESKAVADLAVAAAKNELIEQLTPAIQAIIDGQLRRGALGEDVDRLRRAADGYGETEFEEGKDMKDKKDKKIESVAALFPGVTEVADDIGEADEVAEADDNGYDDVGIEKEAVDDGDSTSEAADMDETLDINEAELEAMYAEALQLEVDVTKGFKDMAKPHELGAGAKAQYQSDPANLADYKSSEAEWDNVEPPEKKDWTVKEVRRMVRKGMAENKALYARNARLTEMVHAMHKQLKEMNLLNTKILHVNRFMQAHGRLTAEQKRTVIESIDRGGTVKEVKSIFSILERSFRSAGAISEAAKRAPHGNSQKVRQFGSTDPRVIRESAGRAEGNSGFNRMQILAGLVSE